MHLAKGPLILLVGFFMKSAGLVSVDGFKISTNWWKCKFQRGKTAKFGRSLVLPSIVEIVNPACPPVPECPALVDDNYLDQLATTMLTG